MSKPAKKRKSAHVYVWRVVGKRYKLVATTYVSARTRAEAIRFVKGKLDSVVSARRCEPNTEVAKPYPYDHSKLGGATEGKEPAPGRVVRGWIHPEDLRRQPLIGTIVGDQHRRIEGLVPVFIVRESDVQRITDRISRNPNSQVHRALRELGLTRSPK